MEQENVQKLLQPGCRNFKAKLAFFCMSEEWVKIDLSNDRRQFLATGFAEFKKSHELAYYHTLFHLLTCPFCLDRGGDILTKRSHPELWKLGGTISEVDCGAIIAEAHKAPHDEWLRYFSLLYAKLGIGTLSFPKTRLNAAPGVYCQGVRQILVQFCKNMIPQEEFTRLLPVAGCGPVENIPDEIIVPAKFLNGGENITLFFKRKLQKKHYRLGFRGGTDRYLLKIKIFFSDNSEAEFTGKEISDGKAKIPINKDDIQSILFNKEK